ncbi:MAG: hypothetical protein ACYS1A_10165 [Planctomycetota bacterium]|jgi:hypothetical protein
MMAQDAVKKLSLVKRVAGLVLLVLVVIVSFTVTFLVMRFVTGPEQVSEVSEVNDESGIFGHVVLMLLGGYFLLGAGVLVYAVTLGTRCFTFDFCRPFWNSVKKKVYVMHIVVIVLTGMGAAAFVSMVVTPILTSIGLSFGISLIVPFMGTFVLVQFLTIWINIWQPLEKSIVKKRLRACGVSEEDIERGIYIGISDPAKSSFKKMTMVEEDVGILWLDADELVYKGDTDSFRVGREQLIEVERAADAGSAAAYFGIVNIIVRFRTDDGTEQRTRLHLEGEWTMGRKAKASDNLAAKLVHWKQVQS